VEKTHSSLSSENVSCAKPFRSSMRARVATPHFLLRSRISRASAAVATTFWRRTIDGRGIARAAVTAGARRRPLRPAIRGRVRSARDRSLHPPPFVRSKSAPIFPGVNLHSVYSEQISQKWQSRKVAETPQINGAPGEIRTPGLLVRSRRADFVGSCFSTTQQARPHSKQAP
jgi:hypothetical protein